MGFVHLFGTRWNASLSLWYFEASWNWVHFLRNRKRRFLTVLRGSFKLDARSLGPERSSQKRLKRLSSGWLGVRKAENRDLNWWNRMRDSFSMSAVSGLG